MKQYLAAIKVNLKNGGTIEGNAPFETERLTANVIETVKANYCAYARAHDGIVCENAKAVVYAIIPLDE